MKRLLIFELVKIFKRKTVWIGIALVLFISITNFTSLSLDNINYERKIAAKYEGPLDNQKVQQMLNDFMPTQEQLEQWHGVHVAYIGMNAIQQAVHLHFANEDGTWNGKTVADVFGEQTIQVGCNSIWMDFSRSLVKNAIVLAILAILMAAPVFSAEYEGMDNLLLTSRLGRTKCALAKTVAVFVAVLSTTVLCILGNIAAARIFFGSDGLDASVLFCGVSYEHYLPFNMNCATMITYQSLLILCGITMLTGITLLISALSKTQVIALIISALILFLPLMFPLSEVHPLFRIAGLLPIYQFQFSSLMSVQQIHGNIYYAIWALPVSAITAALGSILTVKSWQNHQI